MARSTGKDHSQINIDIWGDEAFLDLSPTAQHLYFVLWTAAGLSYCGAGDWRPGRIAQRARGWSGADVERAAIELSVAPEIYLVIDTETEEFLIRSWIKHDGLWRIPNMAVSMANARTELASRTLRGVVVWEVAKLSRAEPTLTSWKRDAVAKLLDQTPVDPSSIPRFNPSPNPPWNLNGNPHDNPAESLSGGVGVNPPANTPPTPAPAPAPSSYLQKKGGLVSPEGNQGETQTKPPPPPSEYCPKHPNGTTAACHDCREIREQIAAANRLAAIEAKNAERAEADQRHAAQVEAAIVQAEAIADCALGCDDEGYLGGRVCDHVDRTETATRGAALVRAELAKAEAARRPAPAPSEAAAK